MRASAPEAAQMIKQLRGFQIKVRSAGEVSAVYCLQRYLRKQTSMVDGTDVRLVLAMDAGTVKRMKCLFTAAWSHIAQASKWLAPQICSKLKRFVLDASSAEARREWQCLMSKFIGLDTPRDTPKPQRLCALGWMPCVDNQLTTSFGCGLKDFLPNPSTRYSRSLTLLLDQEATQWSGVSFFLHDRKLRLLPLYDILHRGWNGIRNSCKLAKTWKSVLDAIIPQNITTWPLPFR